MSEYQVSIVVFMVGLIATIATIAAIYVGAKRWKGHDPYDNEV